MSEIEAKVKEIIVDKLGVPKHHSQTTLVQTLWTPLS